MSSGGASRALCPPCLVDAPPLFPTQKLAILTEIVCVRYRVLPPVMASGRKMSKVSNRFFPCVSYGTVVNMGVMVRRHTLTHLQRTFVTSTEISVNLPRSMVDGELGMARTHFKTVTLGVIAVLFTCLFLVTQKT